MLCLSNFYDESIHIAPSTFINEDSTVRKSFILPYLNIGSMFFILIENSWIYILPWELYYIGSSVLSTFFQHIFINFEHFTCFTSGTTRHFKSYLPVVCGRISHFSNKSGFFFWSIPIKNKIWVLSVLLATEVSFLPLSRKNLEV